MLPGTLRPADISSTSVLIEAHQAAVPAEFANEPSLSASNVPDAIAMVNWLIVCSVGGRNHMPAVQSKIESDLSGRDSKKLSSNFVKKPFRAVTDRYDGCLTTSIRCNGSYCRRRGIKPCSVAVQRKRGLALRAGIG